MEVDGASASLAHQVAEQYSGHVKVARLVHAAQVLSGAARQECLRLAAAELRESSVDVNRYKAVVALAQQAGADDVQTEEASAVLLQQLVNDHTTAVANSVRESQRQASMDLGAFHYDRGDFASASKLFMRSREQCSTAAHAAAFHTAVVRTYVQMANWPMVATYVTKAQAVPAVAPAAAAQSADGRAAAERSASLAAIAGMADMAMGRYRSAAGHFAAVGPVLSAECADAVTSADVARYGTLTALATCERAWLRANLLNDAGFSMHLESLPLARELLEAMASMRYAAVFPTLEALQPQLAIDPHLATCLPDLRDALRSRVLQQYVSPYHSLRLPDMAADLGTTVAALQPELVALVASGAIDARVDSVAKVLYRRTADDKARSERTVLDAADAYIADAHATLLRVQLLKENLKPALPGGGAGERGGGSVASFAAGSPGGREGGPRGRRNVFAGPGNALGAGPR